MHTYTAHYWLKMFGVGGPASCNASTRRRDSALQPAGLAGESAESQGQVAAAPGKPHTCAARRRRSRLHRARPQRAGAPPLASTRTRVLRHNTVLRRVAWPRKQRSRGGGDRQGLRGRRACQPRLWHDLASHAAACHPPANSNSVSRKWVEQARERMLRPGRASSGRSGGRAAVGAPAVAAPPRTNACRCVRPYTIFLPHVFPPADGRSAPVLRDS